MSAHLFAFRILVPVLLGGLFSGCYIKTSSQLRPIHNGEVGPEAQEVETYIDIIINRSKPSSVSFIVPYVSNGERTDFTFSTELNCNEAQVSEEEGPPMYSSSQMTTRTTWHVSLVSEEDPAVSFEGSLVYTQVGFSTGNVILDRYERAPPVTIPSSYRETESAGVEGTLIRDGEPIQQFSMGPVLLRTRNITYRCGR